MGLPRGVLDASVLYPEPVRSLLLWVAAEGGFVPLWTERILEETQNSLIEGGVVVAEQWDRLRRAMVDAFPEAMIEQAAVDAIESDMPNHDKDRHVLAAAVVGDAELVVTSNLRHFLPADLDPLGKRSISPDRLLCDALAADADTVISALRLQAAAMRKPRPWSQAELLGLLAGLGHSDPPMPEFAHAAATTLGIDFVRPPESH